MSTKQDDYLATAKLLASAHQEEDPKTAEVYLFPDPLLVDVRLLEVSASAPRSGDVLPFSYDARPDLGVRFASTVVLLNPDEWRDVLAGDLRLPLGWDLDKREQLL